VPVATRYAVYRYNSTNTALVDIISEATEIRFSRDNEGTERIEFNLARNDVDTSTVAIGTVLRIHDTVLDEDLATGIVAGSLDFGNRGFVRIQAVGARILLGAVTFPAGYVLSGDISDIDNRNRLSQSYDWRLITAVSITNWDGNEVVSFDGDPGGSTQEKHSLTRAIVWNISETGEDIDSGGILTLLGNTDHDGDGIDETQPYTSPGTYASPFLDLVSSPTEFDRLRFGFDGAGGDVEYRINSYSTIGAARTFGGSTLTVADPQGVGADITALTTNRYVALELTLSSDDPDSYSPVVRWIQIIARRSIDGITAMTSIPSVELEDQLNVGGQSLLQALQSLTESENLEFRIDVDGNLEIQAIPASGSIGTVWGSNRTDEFILADGTNCTITSYTTDDSKLANYVVAVGTGGEDDALRVIVQDSTSQSTYGLHQVVVRFNEDTIAGLKTAADAYLADWKDPRKELRVRVTPVKGDDDTVWTFAPGDTVRVTSGRLTNHDGDDIDETARIINESRSITDAGELIVDIALESQRQKFLKTLVRKLGSLEDGVGRSIERTENDTFVTPERADGAIYSETIALDFTPTSVSASILEIQDTTAGAYYTAHGSATQIEIVGPPHIGERSLTIRYGRVAGANNYRATIIWSASGRTTRAEGLG